MNNVPKTLPKSKSQQNKQPAKGEITVETDFDGKATYMFKLPDDIVGDVSDGSSLNFEAEWIGPTREKILKAQTITVANSEWEIRVSLTIDDPLPGFQFGVRVDILDSHISKNSERINLELFRWDGKTPFDKDPNTGNIAILSNLEKIMNCTAVSDGAVTSQCNFALLEIGKYVLVASARDPTGYLVTTALPLGKTSEEWNSQPLRKFDSIHMVADKNIYNRGENAKLTFQFPYKQGVALITWGNAFEIRRFQQKLQLGEETVSIPIGEECSFGGCTVHLTINVPKNSELNLPIPVPISKLFDPKNANSFFLTHHLSVMESKSRNIELSINLEKPIVAPGSETTIGVELRNEDGSPVKGEVTLWLVDTAVFDLSPVALANLSQLLSVSGEIQSSGINVISTLNYLATSKAYKNAYEAIIRRAKLDPWLSFSWPVKPTEWGINELEIDDEVFLKKLRTLITRFPWFSNQVLTLGGDRESGEGRQLFMALDSAMPVAAMKMGGVAHSETNTVMSESASASAEGSMRLYSALAPTPPAVELPSLLRSNFQTTPFFATIKVPTSGNVDIKVKLPDNIGSYLVRAIAVTSDEEFGASETKLITRRQVSLQPSVPRVVRIEDDFYAGVTVQIQPLDDIVDKKETVNVQVDVVAEQGLNLVSPKVQKVSIPYFTPTEVLFHFRATQYGEAVLQFTASCSTSQDAVEVTIPILAPQDSVFVATSFALEQKEGSEPWLEGVALPDAIEGTGNFTVEAGVGRLPSVLLLSEGLFSLLDKYQNGDTILTSLAPKGALYSYQSISDSMKKTLEERFTKSIQLLHAYTDPSVGLVYYKDRYGPYTPVVDCYLNAYGLLIESLLLRNSQKIPTEISSVWKLSLENGLVELASNARRYNYRFNDFSLLALSRLVLGSKWTPYSSPEIVSDLSFARLEENLDNCGVFCKAATGLIYIRENNKSNKLLKQIVTYLESSLRVQGRTAYVSASLTGGSPYPAGTVDNAFALTVLMNSNLSNPLVEKLANYLSKNAATYGFSSFATAITAFTLSEYDFLKGSTSPNVDFSLTSGNRKILTQTFDSASIPPIKRVWGWEALERDPLGGPLPLQFSVKGRGEISVALGLNFIPRKIFNEPVYRGIYVEKVITNIDPFTHESLGGALFNSTPGTTVKVTIQISTPDDLSNVMIVDLLPGGLEAMDPNVAQTHTTPSSTTVHHGGIRGKRIGYAVNPPPMEICYWCWWTAFPSRETRKDRVTFSSNWLHAGTHTVSYEALVVTSGTFTLPPSKAFVLAQPEVMGLSAGGTFFVEQRQ